MSEPKRRKLGGFPLVSLALANCFCLVKVFLEQPFRSCLKFGDTLMAAREPRSKLTPCLGFRPGDAPSNFRKLRNAGEQRPALLLSWMFVSPCCEQPGFAFDTLSESHRKSSQTS